MSVPLPSPQMTLRFGGLDAGRSPFLVAGMFTASYLGTTNRLLASLRALGVPHALFEVPTVHRSISPKGSDDPAYTKAAFIAHLLAQTGRHILYLDTDTVIRRPPAMIAQLTRTTCDFAIFNWLTSEANDAYVPVGTEPPAPGQPDLRRFFLYSHSIDMVARDQLVCSGAVQLWAPTAAAGALLAGWQETIAAQPGVPDDQCLDFAFNNRVGQWPGALNAFWLPKSYARYAWWIFDEPIIDHPDFPFSGQGLPKIHDPSGRQRLYPERTTNRKDAPAIPRDCIFDAGSGTLYQKLPDRLAPVGRCARRAWLPPDKVTAVPAR